MLPKSLASLLVNRLAAVIVLASVYLPACLAAELEITRWSVPWPDSRPRDPALTSDGTVWFAGQKGDYIASFDPGTGAFDRVELPRGAGPHNVVVDRADRVWIAGNRQAWIGTYEPASGRLDTIALPQPAARDPHTLVFASDGTLWFYRSAG